MMWYILGLLSCLVVGLLVLFLGKKYTEDKNPIACGFAGICVLGLIPVLNWVAVGLLLAVILITVIYAVVMSYLEGKTFSHYMEEAWND